MHPDRDFDARHEPPPQASAVTQDLELDTLLAAMSAGDAFILDVARTALLSGLENDAWTVLYRQAVLRDCLEHPDVARELYALAVEGVEGRRKLHLSLFANHPGAILHDSIAAMRMFAGVLIKLREVAEAQAGRFHSPAFVALFATLEEELSDEYMARVDAELTELRFRGGVLLSGELGEGNAGAGYTLRRANGRGPSWLERLLGKAPPAHTFYIADRDESGARALVEIQDRGINVVANALAQSADHIQNFFWMLRAELAFYIGCLNLHERLVDLGVPVCFPRPEPPSSRRLNLEGLCDPCLALSLKSGVVGNSLNADGKSLLVVTGANQGGKSTFLRSVGLAQLMLHAGTFVVARDFAAELCTGLFTHYKREEDATMQSGKLDEELRRMSEIADLMRGNAVVLFNESFAATNEREGSEIARQVVDALLEHRIKVIFVTHQYEFAHEFFTRQLPEALFLRAERQPDGTRTFRLTAGEPLETSYGEDLYREVFGEEAAVTG